MPRSKLTDDPGFIDRFMKAFHTNVKYDDMAKDLGVCSRTVRRYAKDIGINYKMGRPLGKTSGGKLTGGLAQWVTDNPKEKLPRKVKDIVKKTGLSKDQVKSSLYRLKRKYYRRVRSLGNIRTFRGGIRGSKGTIIPFSDIGKFQIFGTYYSDHIRLKVTTKEGEMLELKTSLTDLEKLKREEE